MRRRNAIVGFGCAVAIGLGAGLATTASATPDTTYYTNIDTDNTMSANGGYVDEAVSCNAGDTAVSGGFRSNNNAKLRAQASAPTLTSGVPTGWNASAYNEDTVSRDLYVYVVCKDT